MLLVDAANVVGSRPTGWWRDRPGAARRLVAQVRAAVAGGHLVPPVTIVLEGAARLGAEEGEADGVNVVHARADGDSTLSLLAAEADGPIVLVSADRGLCRRVARPGVTCVGPGWLLSRLTGAPGREER